MSKHVPVLLWRDARARVLSERHADLPARNEVVVMGSLGDFARRDVMAVHVMPVVPRLRRRGVALTLAVLHPAWATVEVILMRPTPARLEAVRRQLARLARA